MTIQELQRKKTDWKNRRTRDPVPMKKLGLCAANIVPIIEPNPASPLRWRAESVAAESHDPYSEVTVGWRRTWVCDIDHGKWEEKLSCANTVDEVRELARNLASELLEEGFNAFFVTRWDKDHDPVVCNWGAPGAYHLVYFLVEDGRLRALDAHGSYNVRSLDEEWVKESIA